MRTVFQPLFCSVALLALFASSPASAQYRPYRQASVAIGEDWRTEFTFGTWSPGPVFTVRSTSGEAVGTDVAAQSDLGVQSRLLKEFSIAFRPAVKHKVLVACEPISYSASTALARALVFDGAVFAAGETLGTSIDWKSWTFGYEYDFIYRARMYAGFIANLRHDNITVGLSGPTVSGSSNVTTSFPMLGGVVRLYPLSNVSLTGQFTGWAMPNGWKDLTGYVGHSYDLDFYATLNFRNNFGIRTGYRSVKVTYNWDQNRDDLIRRGPYLMGVVRF